VSSRTRRGSAIYAALAAADPAVAGATRLDQVAGYIASAAVGLVPLAAFGGLMWVGALNKSAGRTDNPARVAAAASFA
jgi:hypothetical protein